MLASGFGQQDQRLEFDALLTAARQAQSMNNYASAADFYKKAVKIQGDLPELWTNLGLMEHETGDYDEAIAWFTRTLGFALVEDTDLGGSKRWVLVEPPGRKQ